MDAGQEFQDNDLLFQGLKDGGQIVRVDADEVGLASKDQPIVGGFDQGFDEHSDASGQVAGDLRVRMSNSGQRAGGIGKGFPIQGLVEKVPQNHDVVGFARVV